MKMLLQPALALAHPGYEFNGRTYKTVNGLLNALVKDSPGATEAGMVSSFGTITTYGDGRFPVNVYDITPPARGRKQVVTRCGEMTPARINAMVASAWNAEPHAGADVAMTPDKAALLTKAERLRLLQSLAADPANHALFTVTEIAAAISVVNTKE